VDEEVPGELWAAEGECVVEVLHEDEVDSVVIVVDVVVDEAVSARAEAHHGVEVRQGVEEVIDLCFFRLSCTSYRLGHSD
jgi:hypothetical protein